MKDLVVPLEAWTVAQLTRIGDKTGRPAPIVVRDWIVERLVGVDERGNPTSKQNHLSGATSDADALRDRYRPDDVVVLLVGESAPAGGTFFYQGDSHLFRATRHAFERALGPMPEGIGFLDHFKDLGFWLYDVAPDPVNRSRGRPRKDAVNSGIAALADLIRDLDPDHVVGIKTSLEGPIKAAATVAGFPAYRLLILPFPLYQWREEYIEGLTRFLQGQAAAEPDARDVEPMKPPPTTLHGAMTEVLRLVGGGPKPARWVANEVAARKLYLRGDGSRADYQQILLRARKYPHLFEVDQSGVRLRTDTHL